MSSNDPQQHADDSPSNFLSIMSKKCTVCDISKDLILAVIIMSGRTDKEIANCRFNMYMVYTAYIPMFGTEHGTHLSYCSWLELVSTMCVPLHGPLPFSQSRL